jgi:hypothetical protein
MKPWIYCATPTKMEKKTDKIMEYVILEGFIPIHPFKVFPLKLFEYGKIFTRDEVMEECLRLVDCCNEVWVFGFSEGVNLEINHANRRHIPVFMKTDLF